MLFVYNSSKWRSQAALAPLGVIPKKSLRTTVNCCYGDHKLVMCHTQAAVNTVSVNHRGVSASHTLKKPKSTI